MIAVPEFELYLLAHMRAAEPHVERLLSSHNLTKSAMQDAKERVADMGFNQPGYRADLYTRVLGAPVEVSPELSVDAQSSFADSTQWRFHLRLWPAFDLLIREARDGLAWGEEIIRRRHTPIPAAASISDLKPWSLVESEARERFGALYEDGWNWSTDIECMIAPNPGELPVQARLCFDYGLLQSVEF